MGSLSGNLKSRLQSLASFLPHPRLDLNGSLRFSNIYGKVKSADDLQLSFRLSSLLCSYLHLNQFYNSNFVIVAFNSKFNFYSTRSQLANSIPYTEFSKNNISMSEHTMEKSAPLHKEISSSNTDLNEVDLGQESVSWYLIMLVLWSGLGAFSFGFA